jgi:repressor LexA
MPKTKTIGLTPKQMEVLAIIKRIGKRGFPPTISEIGIALGSKATLNVRRHLDGLQEKGYIHRTPDVARGIKVLK